MCKVLSHAFQSSNSPSPPVPFIKPTFRNFYFKLFFNPITKETMTNLQNTVKSLGIFVFRKCFAADHQSAVLELLLVNSRRTPLWPKIWPISKTLSQAFYSPFSAGLFVRIMEPTFSSLYCEIFT